MMMRSFRRSRFARQHRDGQRNGEQGVTMVFVALSMVALIAMAALSIDVVTLYLDREEAQRSADAAALAAARVISISGITGAVTTNPASWQAICGTSGTATEVAQKVAAQNAVGGVAPTVTVTYSAAGSSAGNTDCSSGLSQAFAINPTVIVKVQRTGLPTMFSRIWSRSSNTVSATAAAEVFNPSDSGTFTLGGDVVPVVPRCVKPWIIPDEDPNGGRWVNRGSGRIGNAGISSIDGGVIGEQFTLQDNCSGTSCSGMPNPPGAGGGVANYIPALISTTPAVAVPPSCVNNNFQNAISGCDISTVYACGTPSGAQADLSTSYDADTSAAVKCLTNIPIGNDTITPTYPFEITAGSSNPIAPANQVITSSNSIMTLPIYDDYMGQGTPQPLPTGTTTPPVTIVGFLQVFVKDVPSTGTMLVTVLNVAGCGNDASTTLKAPGTSPVPIRLITTQ